MNQAVFLDRDGVINEVLSHRVKFVNKPSDFHLLNGVGQAIKQLNEAGFLVFVVTNQGGIGLGYMTEERLKTIHQTMVDQLAEYGAVIHDISYCSHKPHADCPCRKPKAYMLEELAKKHQVNLGISIMVGDREPDILAGKKAGCQTVLVNAREDTSYGADAVFSDLEQATPWMIHKRTIEEG
ncbi:HAD family hydrolase [Alkalihalobacillus sp. FSL W8-0930]